MRIDNVRLCQTFGTKVQLTRTAVRYIKVSGASRKVLSDIKILEANGKDDVLTLTHCRSVNKDGKSVLKIIASVYEKQGKNELFSLNNPCEEIVVEKKKNNNKYIDIKKMYKEAKESLTQYKNCKNFN